MHMEQPPQQITYWDTNQPSTSTKNRDHTVHVFRPQCYETQNQPQEKIWKDHKYLEIKEHPTEE